MTLAEIDPVVVEESGPSSETSHIVCDWQNQQDIAMCGASVSGQPCVEWVPEEDECVVCRDLEPLHEDQCPTYSFCNIRIHQKEKA